MAEEHSQHGPMRARPLAELDFEGLLDRLAELARQWAVALILDGSPQAIGRLPLTDLAGGSPEFLGAVLKALRSEAELAQLLDGGRSGTLPAERIGAMTGAVGPAALVDAVEVLRGVIWEALLDEFGYRASEPSRARRLIDLADRLAAVCSATLARALEGAGPALASVGPAEKPSAVPASVLADTGLPHPWTFTRSGAVIVDEWTGAESTASEPQPEIGPEPVTAGVAHEVVPEPALSAEIQIRDERGDEGPAAWTRSIGRQLERFERDGAPFAVLLVELRGEHEGSWDRVEELISGELRAAAAGTMTRERAGRYWLLSTATDRLGAGALAARLGRELAELLRAQRLELSLAIGTANCPEDGRRASALAAHADVSLCAARSEFRQPAPVEGRGQA